MSNRESDKKKTLLSRKEQILRELKYYEKRIEILRSSNKNSFYDDDSSDSELEFALDIGPSMTELKDQQKMMRTCLYATQELTSLNVLQSEANVMVDTPIIDREPPVTVQGVWREVTAECRVDLVPFSMTFCVHKSNQLFGPTSYRNLTVTPVKEAHEKELAKSVLSAVTLPSDAVEVLKNYAAAHRSRRSTLARLAERFADSLFMEPMPDGGYLLKCANLLEVSWTLQNKWSPIAPFHHRMKFDLEYMDEAYIKIITQAHRQLLDPTVETDERTLLMAKIITTCLEAERPTQELYDSMESDSESRKLRTTLDEEPDVPAMKKNKDREVMAPPKTVPKKTKPKGKENTADNQSKNLKRASDTDIDNTKRSKLNSDTIVASSINDEFAKTVMKTNAQVEGKAPKNADKSKKDTESQLSDKFKSSNEQKKDRTDPKDKDNNDPVASETESKRQKKDKNVMGSQSTTKPKIDNTQNTENTVSNSKRDNESAASQTKNSTQKKDKTSSTNKLRIDNKNNNEQENKDTDSKSKKESDTQSNKLKPSQQKKDKENIKSKKDRIANSNLPKKLNSVNVQEKDNIQKENTIDLQSTEKVKPVSQHKKGVEKPTSESKKGKDTKDKDKDTIGVNTTNKQKTASIKKIKEQKNPENLTKPTENQSNLQNIKANEIIANKKVKDNLIMNDNNPKKAHANKLDTNKRDSDKIINPKNITKDLQPNNIKQIKTKVGSMKLIQNTNNIRKSLGVVTKVASKLIITKDKVVTKIPRKRLSAASNKKNLRLSPRKPHTKIMVQDISKTSSQRSLLKPVTNIPRLLKAPSKSKT